jgi:thymidine kinase
MMENGRIEVILGCMFSGKTTELIRVYQKWHGKNQEPLVINFEGDTRYGDDDQLRTHNKLSVKCIKVNKLNNVDIELIQNANIILINEGQFFSDLVEFCKYWTDEQQKYIVVCGLDGDYKREPFQNIMNLIPLANSVTKLTGFCDECIHPVEAVFTGRITNSDERILIGGNDMYKPLCRYHYLELEKSKNLPKPVVNHKRMRNDYLQYSDNRDLEF